VLLRLLSCRQLQPGGCGLVRGAYPPVMSGGELPAGCPRSGSGGHGEGLRRSHGEAAGVKPGASLVNRTAVNAGTARGSFHRLRSVGPVFVERPDAG
jgi:hypothetical protein